MREASIHLRRAYEPAGRNEGKRYLVERLWPRGVKKESLQLDGWLKDVAPSTELRQWFHHDPERWPEFRHRYFVELRSHPQAVEPLLDAARHGPVTLIYGARDTEHNAAVALKEYLERHL